ncbi:MAG TPA: CpaD family pilus assembly protein [Sphingomicrobium sp.]|nr:CpaD family pilus assembly protein [Sphingomicrobium sp.]
MRRNLIGLVLVAAVAGCATPGADTADRGLQSVNQPGLARSMYVVDLAAPGGFVAPAELARLDSWFQGLGLGYGDSIYVDGGYAEPARSQVAEIAGRYGLMVNAAAPVTAGAVAPDMVRVVVSRTRAQVPGCPNWATPSQPNFENRSMSNFGCAVNSNLAAMVANPEDLFHGREGGAVGDAATAAKAVESYRRAAPSGEQGLQDISTRKEEE